MRVLLLKIINKVFCLGGMKTIPSDNNVIYLTFDDGPETGITEFILNELDKYNFKATFFCRGDNANKNQKLMAMLLEKGHTIGNHTYSHLHSYEVNTQDYINDVKQADDVLHTEHFRPPHGSLTLWTWWELHKKYKIYFWSVNSGDSDMEDYDYKHSIDNLKNGTRGGAIVLFHFCHRHEQETRQLLPEYLKWLNKQGYKSAAIK